MQRIWCHLLLGLALLASARAESPVPEWHDVDGVARSPLTATNARAVVLLFLVPDCPVANRYAPEVQRLAALYRPKGVVFHLVYVDPTLTSAQIQAHRREYGYKLPAFLDAQHVLVHQTGVKVTPEVAVVDSAGKVLYHGRIDDRAADYGKQRLEPHERDLQEALDAILAGQPVPHPVTQAIGCYIPPLRTALRP